MLSDSLGQVLGLTLGSMENAGGSVSEFLGNGIGSLSDNLTTFLDTINTASGAAE